ncbi:uncharacterized protein LOC126845402 [Adelges cooleyi]|uniref:uncharacterized protein LOC126845402 n=1 Tax=Adelges cooleyi TaxID=133065 RepID=UPI00217FAB80|nr:uncharacterized protein LOC126845402 [Adelges cooleyi]
MSKGNTYCLIVVDRFSRWPDAFSIPDIKTETVIQALFAGWIARHGAPDYVTTDQGGQFESTAFNKFAAALGAKRIRTTAYHPTANGLVERLHRPLKAAIRANETERWVEVLPLILLGFRASIKEDLGVTPAKMVYGATLRLPGDFLHTNRKDVDPVTFVGKLKDDMRELRPVPTLNHSKRKVFIHPKLKECTHVFLQKDKPIKSLERPYDGPFKVMERDNKVFKIQAGKNLVNVTIDRIKPCFLVNPTIEEEYPANNIVQSDQAPGVQQPESDAASVRPQKTSRSGRVICFPRRFLS